MKYIIYRRVRNITNRIQVLKTQTEIISVGFPEQFAENYEEWVIDRRRHNIDTILRNLTGPLQRYRTKIIIMHLAKGDALSDWLKKITTIDHDQFAIIYRAVYDWTAKWWMNIFSHDGTGHFHADPHGGNVFLDVPDDRRVKTVKPVITVIDFGAVGRFPKSQRMGPGSFLKLLTALSTNNDTYISDELASILYELSPVQESL